MVIIIPAAGHGSRFVAAGYTVPKPLIHARGIPMILRVANMLPAESKILVPCRETIAQKIKNFGFEPVAYPITPNGTALSVLGAGIGRIADNEDVLIVNSDNIFSQWAIEDFVKAARESRQEGSILGFVVDGGPWSYMKLGVFGNVVKVAEKQKISNVATAGAYYFKKWGNLKDAICSMVATGDTTNGEYYLAPVYNYLLGRVYGSEVSSYLIPASDFIPLGTPEDLEKYNAAR